MGSKLTTLIEPQILTAGLVTYYTAGVTTRIDQMTVTNPTGTPATVTVNWVPKGGTAGVGNTIVFQRPINAGEAWSASPMIGHTLSAADFIQIEASVATTLVIAASGVQATQ